MTSAKVARRVVEKLNLQPPVDISSLLEDSADVCELDWPQECDGIVVGLAGQSRPKVFLRAGQHLNRDRFTRAHEWGHIMIPWHLGDVALECEIDRLDPTGQFAEREANDFASRVLVPDRYLRQAIAASSSVENWLDAVEECQVSAYASLLALTRDLGAGFAFLLDQGDSKPVIQILSSGTQAPLIDAPGKVREEFARNSLASGRKVLRGRRVEWFQYVDLTAPELPQGRNATEALNAYIARTGERLSDGRNKRSSINGIVGGKLRDNNLVDLGWMHGMLRYHIELDPAWNHALTDPDFEDFLVLRVAELSERRQKGSSRI